MELGFDRARLCFGLLVMVMLLGQGSAGMESQRAVGHQGEVSWKMCIEFGDHGGGLIVLQMVRCRTAHLFFSGGDTCMIC